MPINARQKGSRGEREVRDLVQRYGWSVKMQPSSGAFGTRINETRLKGDLRILCGDADLRVEVKRRKSLPKVMEGWQVGCEILAMRADQGDWRISMTGDTFGYLLGLAAQSMPPAPPKRAIKSRGFR